MKTCTVLCILLASLAFLLTPLKAMPPHPDLLRQIRNHEIPEPYYLQHYRDIRARGVDAPQPCSSIEMLRQRALDEDINIIAILMDFSDHGAHTEAGYFDSLLFGHRTGTLRDFYSQVSYGNLTLITINWPGVMGWNRAPHTYSYYVNNQNGFGDYPQNAQRLAEDAVNLVNPDVDFSQYDNDGDGYVDALFIIHTGPGAERTGRSSDIWSHKWQMANSPQVDGVVASVYSMEPEYWDSYGDMTCGVYAHEMGHSVFGLPDLYDYDYDSEGLGNWSLMAGGSWNGALGASPANPDARSRIQMGFVTPVNVVGNLSHVALPRIESAPVIYRLWTDGLQGSQYFLVENRQQAAYDRAIPSNGLLIYHVDDSQGGNDHQWYPGYTGNGNYRVALEQADGLWNLEHNSNAGDGADPFPGGTESHIFSQLTTPNSEAYNLSDTHVSVRHISNSADTMYASFFVSSSLTTNPVFVFLPDSFATADAAIRVPLNVENDLAGRNVTAFHFTVNFNANLLTAEAPYYDRQGALVPQSWNVTASYNAGVLTLNGSGNTPLSGSGVLVFLRLRALQAAPDQAGSLLSFTNFSLNQGTPPTDTTNGRIIVQAPNIALTPTRVELGAARVGTSVVYDAFVIRNFGSANLVVDSLQAPSFITTDFQGPQTILPNRWYPVRVQFAPAAEQLFSDTLRVYSSDYTGLTRMPVRGRGALPHIFISTYGAEFDTVGVGHEADYTITLTDTGYWPTTITGLSFSSGSVFHLVGDAPSEVPARGEVQFSVRFTPTLGEWRDTLTITNDAGAPFTVALHGVGAVLSAGNGFAGGIPAEFALSSNYPNPFNPSTSLNYDIPRSAWVTLTVYDVLGRKVDQPLQGMMQPGRYNLTWACPNCGSGIYFFVLASDGVRLSQKAMLMR